MPDTPFGFAFPGGQPPDPNDPQQMQQFLAGLQQLMAMSQPGGGPVNWDLARQVATTALNTEGDPAVSAADRAEVGEALRLADLWLEPVTSLPSGLVSTAAWNRNEWIFNTLDVWRKLADPVAGRMVAAMSDLVPPERRAQLGPMAAMINGLGGALFGGQFGQALAKLATEVLSAGDIGLPLGPAGTAALVPANIRAYGEGLELDAGELRLFVALREAAHQRLFGHVPWLRGHVLSAVEAYANGIKVDREAIEEALGRIDPADPESMSELRLEGIFTPEDSEQQRAALNRLETTLALVEGWVCHTVEAAAAGRLPNVVRLSETFRRRRAAGGPAEQTFAALVGLELRPRRLREAAALWTALTEHRGVDGRDALWAHPDLLPDDEAFADPVAYATHAETDWDISALENLAPNPEPGPADDNPDQNPDGPH
ncbi:hydrolase [Catellatospora sp. TT07R-123]|uniref:zinc-dependent metalloprotease n=1 Tax=Catellatospora sp. TT07R-123 TaxID=2733863 RepID=UPI001B2D1372|nr:zinc-dependent metalloprotease [Catellatospora sp. TT07R-123]GHJ50181.1 hydrolase [Catellatospora sp. TT07R-123]